MGNTYTQAEPLAEVEEMSLGDTVAFIAILKADAMTAKARTHARTTNSSTTLTQDRKNTKGSTGPRVQDVHDTTALKVIPPNPMLP